MEKNLEREVSEKLGWSSQQIAMSRNKDMLLALSQHTAASTSFEQPSVCVRRKVFVTSPGKTTRSPGKTTSPVRKEAASPANSKPAVQKLAPAKNKIDVQGVLTSGTDDEMLDLCTRLSTSLKTLRIKKANLSSQREKDTNVILFDATIEQIDAKIDKRMQIACKILEHLDARIKHMLEMRSVFEVDDEYVLHDLDTSLDSNVTEQQINTRMSAMPSCIDVLRA